MVKSSLQDPLVRRSTEFFDKEMVKLSHGIAHRGGKGFVLQFAPATICDEAVDMLLQSLLEIAGERRGLFAKLPWRRRLLDGSNEQCGVIRQ